MSTKPVLQALRDSNLGDTAPASPSTPLRDPVCDRAAFDALLQELFGVTCQLTHDSDTYTLKSGTSIQYQLYVHKSGQSAHIRGSVQNVTGSDLTGTHSIFSWLATRVVSGITYDNEIIPEFDGLGNINMTAKSGSNLLNLLLDGDGLHATSTLLAGATYNFEWNFYFVKQY